MIFKIIYYYISNFRVQNFFFPCAKKDFFRIKTDLAPLLEQVSLRKSDLNNFEESIKTRKAELENYQQKIAKATEDLRWANANCVL